MATAKNASPPAKKVPAKTTSATKVAKTAPASPVAAKPPAKSADKAPAAVSAPATPAKAKAAVNPIAAKPAKAAKPKRVRDSFTMPKPEFTVLEDLKKRAASLKQPAKKSALLRAGIRALAAMPDAAFIAAVQALPGDKAARKA